MFKNDIKGKKIIEENVKNPVCIKNAYAFVNVEKMSTKKNTKPLILF